jgi:hypothetical protein
MPYFFIFLVIVSSGENSNAIEEELEVLYDAYYEELEQYANYQQRYVNSGGTLTPPPGPGPFPGSVELDKNGVVIGQQKSTTARHPPRTAAKQLSNLTNEKKVPVKATSEFYDDDGEEEYEEEEECEESEEDDEDPNADEEDKRPNPRRPVAQPNRGRRLANNSVKVNGPDGLFTLGGSLTVTGKSSPFSDLTLFYFEDAGPGNILTVADDLLKNDGQKFLEMMEQLAERRMQREEDAAADVEDDSEEEEEDREEDDGEDDEEDDEEEEGDEEVWS